MQDMHQARPDQIDQHLSQINTMWTVVFQAQGGSGQAVSAAQSQLLERYSGAVYRYLLAAVHDANTADDLFQELALRLVRGDFKHANPGRGRFRNFLKTSLFHLIVDHQRRGKRLPVPLAPDHPDPAVAASPSAEADQEFRDLWRAELIKRTWDALADLERQTGQNLHTVLRYRTDHPKVRSSQMAEELSAVLRKRVNADWVRRRVFLAREKFTDLLLEEVARSLEGPTPQDLEQELGDLGLLDYCRARLERRRRTDL